MSLEELIQSGDPSALKTALELDPDMANQMVNGVSGLLTALYYRRSDLAALIQAKKSKLSIYEATALGELESLRGATYADNIDAPQADGFNALQLAAFFGQAGAVNFLLDHGANPNLRAQNPIGSAPIHAALAGGFVGIARTLANRGADLHLPGGQGFTVLHYCAELGDAQLAQEFLNQGANSKALTDSGLSASDLGRQVGHDEVAKVIDSWN